VNRGGTNLKGRFPVKEEMMRPLWLVWLLVVFAAGCGSDGGTTNSPSPPTPGTTITIASSGVTPKNLQISPGTQVTFVNNDNRNHDMSSDPHPEHTDCPEINQVGVIVPGQTKQTGNLNTRRVCGFHDHDDPQNTRWQGQITIQ
jgi:plastocyanin